MNDWKQQDMTHMPPLAIAFMPRPVQQREGEEESTEKPTLKMCQWVEGTSNDTIQRVSLPAEIRSKWLSDPVHNPEWHAAIAAWDNALRDVAAPIAAPIAPVAGDAGEPAPIAPMAPIAADPATSPELDTTWEGEPKLAAEFSEKYTVKMSVAADSGNGSIAITECGKIFAVAADDKVFNQSKMNIFAGHGAGDWVKPPRSADIAGDSMSFPFSLDNDNAVMVLESKMEGRQTMKDTERCSLRQLLHDMEPQRGKLSSQFYTLCHFCWWYH